MAEHPALQFAHWRLLLYRRFGVAADCIDHAEEAHDGVEQILAGAGWAEPID